MGADNKAETEPTQEDDLAVVAAMDLLTQAEWKIENIARALRRPIDWLQAEIDKALAAEARGAMH